MTREHSEHCASRRVGMECACNCTVYTEPLTIVTDITASHLEMMGQVARSAATHGRFGYDPEPVRKVWPSWDLYSTPEDCDEWGLGWLALVAVVCMIVTAIAVVVGGAMLADWVLP